MKKWWETFVGFTLEKRIQKFIIMIGLIYTVFFVLLNILFVKPSIEADLQKKNDEMLSVTSNAIQVELDKIDILGRQIMANSKIISYLRGDETASAQNEIIADIYSTVAPFNKISSIYILRNDGHYLSIANTFTEVSQEIITSPSWNQKIDDAQGRLVLMSNGAGAFKPKSSQGVLTLARQFNDINTQKPIGKLIINISKDIVMDLLPKGANLEVRMGTTQTVLVSQLTNEDVRAHQQNSLHMRQYPLTISLYETNNMLISDFKILIFGLFFFGVITLVLMWLILIFVKKSLVYPLEKLVAGMEDVGKGKLKKINLPLEIQELEKVKNTFNQMTVEIDQLFFRLEENQRKIKNAEFETIQQQIKPHFLYNTLDMIAYLALEEKRETVYEAIESLGHFYRNFLSDGESEISLRQEIEIVENYVLLQNFRYGNLIEMEYIVEEGYAEFKIPKIILQPLIENSIYHGIRPKGEAGKIKLTIRHEDTDLKIIVEDNGVGVTATELEKVLAKSEGFGLSRTAERLSLIYNREIAAVCQVESEVGRYFRVTLSLPLEG